jgi:hypothetical protein
MIEPTADRVEKADLEDKLDFAAASQPPWLRRGPIRASDRLALSGALVGATRSAC